MEEDRDLHESTLESTASEADATEESDDAGRSIASVTPPPAPKEHLTAYCPYRQASLLQQALAPDKMRIAFLLGAGCPMAINVDDKGGYEPLIPDVKGLTSKVSDSIRVSTEKTAFETVLKRLKETGKDTPNVEEILSFIRALAEVAGDSGFEGLTTPILMGLDKAICKVTTDTMKVRLPTDGTPYHQLATWIRGISRNHPIEIFTCNYDLLMEQALEEQRVPYFDGFVGSDYTFFDLPSIEQDNLPARWSRLWKIHGSINWWRTEAGDFERRVEGHTGDQQMIYPSHLKYLESRRMPYLAMFDRLKKFLATGQAVLITCGYSFADQHVNEAIFQGLSGNPMAVCFGLIFGDLGSVPDAVTNARKHGNLRLLGADSAVLGTVEGAWISEPKLEHPLHDIAVQQGDFKYRTTAPSETCKFLLGDFASLGSFLTQQIAYGKEDA